MKRVRSLIYLFLAVVLMSAAPQSCENNCKVTGRLKVSCNNVPDEILSENIKFNWFLEGDKLYSEENFIERTKGFFDAAEDSYWPAGFYSAQITGLFEREILVRNVEIKCGKYTFLGFDYEVLNKLDANSDQSQPLVIEWKTIAPVIYKDSYAIDAE